MAISLFWTKCQGDIWCDFFKLNLEHPHFNNLNGVYIIWSGKQVIRVGSGNIKERIAAHRNDLEITTFPDLKVVWAKVDELNLKGVEKFLSESLNPLISERFPNDIPIPVNFPWW